MENKRWNDPEAWKCLDDNQREIINAWYKDIREMYKKEEDCERRCTESAGFFAMIPLAAGYAYKYLSDGVWNALFQGACAWLFYVFILYAFSSFYKHFNNYTCEEGKMAKLRVLGQALVAILVSLCMLSLVDR